MAARLTDADYADLAQFRFSIRQFLAFSEGKAAENGLTAQQHQALLVIRAAGEGAATVGHVADQLILKPHSATGLVDRLVTLDLVRRQPSPHDKRRTLLVLTDRAHDTLETLSATHREEILRLRPALIEILQNMQSS